MPRVRANGLDIEYEEFGDPDHPALVLVMGLGAQLLSWDEDFCRMLVDRGFRVVRFDNRDAGLSTKIEGAPRPDLLAAVAGDTSTAAYTLDDMAEDTLGLFDALGIPAAHVVGASLGGMIAQALAIRSPARVLSLTSMMSSTGDRKVGQPTPTGLALLLAPTQSTREERIEARMAALRTIASPAYPFDEAWTRTRVATAVDRSYYPRGVARQLMAILASPDRTPALRRLAVPTLVIHGDADQVISPSGGRATAEAIPGALLQMVPGMGHDLPIELWPTVVDAIAANAARAPAGGGARASGVREG